jgi:hypothetical protein
LKVHYLYSPLPKEKFHRFLKAGLYSVVFIMMYR